MTKYLSSIALFLCLLISFSQPSFAISHKKEKFIKHLNEAFSVYEEVIWLQKSPQGVMIRNLFEDIWRNQDLIPEELKSSIQSYLLSLYQNHGNYRDSQKILPAEPLDIQSLLGLLARIDYRNQTLGRKINLVLRGEHLKEEIFNENHRAEKSAYDFYFYERLLVEGLLRAHHFADREEKIFIGGILKIKVKNLELIRVSRFGTSSDGNYGYFIDLDPENDFQATITYPDQSSNTYGAAAILPDGDFEAIFKSEQEKRSPIIQECEAALSKK